MTSEFALAVDYYKLFHGVSVFEIDKLEHSTILLDQDDNSYSELEITDSSHLGVALTSFGPAPYTGDILDSPDIVWSDDVWTQEREDEALLKLSQQGAYVSEFWRKKYEAKAGNYWHSFYQRNTDNFYKDRHYLHVVFPELINSWRNNSPVGYNAAVRSSSGTSAASQSLIDFDSQPLYLLEVGCGVGNAVLPLVELNPKIDVTAFDFARSAIDILSRHPLVLSSGRLHPSVCDLVNDPLPVSAGSMDLVLCMFVLSALGPDYQLAAIKKLADALRPGGKLLVRDYGRFDEAQLRFKKGSKLGENFYVRQDGTCSYFFTLERITELCELAGLRCEECENVQRQYANRQQKAARYRVWIQGKFVKV